MKRVATRGRIHQGGYLCESEIAPVRTVTGNGTTYVLNTANIGKAHPAPAGAFSEPDPLGSRFLACNDIYGNVAKDTDYAFTQTLIRSAY